MDKAIGIFEISGSACPTSITANTRDSTLTYR